MKALAYPLLLAVGMTANQAVLSAEPARLENRFDRSEVEWIRQAGNSSISGEAFLKLEDGTIKSCSGFNVELLPVAKYSSDRIARTYGNTELGQVLLEDNPPTFTPDAREYHEMVLKSVCNERGEFFFGNIASGAYYVIAFIIWDAEGKDGVPARTGGGVMKRITVEPHSENRIRLEVPDTPHSDGESR